MTIKAKVLTFGAVIIALVTLVAFFAGLGISKLDNSFISLQKHEITTKVETIKIGREINYVSRLTRNIMLGSDFDKDMSKLDETIAKISKSFDALQKAADSQEEKKLVEQAKSDALAFVNDGRSRMAALKDIPKENRYTAFKEYEQFATPLAMKSRDTFESIIKNADKQFEDGNKQFESIIRRTFTIITTTSVVATVLVVIALFTLLRIILGPIASLKTSLQQIRTSWDLSRHLDTSSKDEMGQIASEINAFIDALKEVIAAVKNSSTRVAGSSISLTDASEQIATSIEEVGAQAATVAAASEEMASTINNIAMNCNRAAELSNQANGAAGTGSKVVRETVAGMARIAEKVKQSAETVASLGARSDQIGAIIGTIEDIADQTNLLALNAAIEAARAGEQGRGFAVVADEVRALAERTTRATREIGEMIKAIQSETKGAVAIMEEGVHEVERGTSEASKSGIALEEIQEKISELSMQVHQIATATEEQSATIGEITSNIHQISGVIDNASDGTQQTSHAAHELNSMADQLQRLVQQFKV